MRIESRVASLPTVWAATPSLFAIEKALLQASFPSMSDSRIDRSKDVMVRTPLPILFDAFPVDKSGWTLDGIMLCFPNDRAEFGKGRVHGHVDRVFGRDSSFALPVEA